MTAHIDERFYPGAVPVNSRIEPIVRSRSRCRSMTASAPWLRRVLIGLPFLWLAVFFLAPLLIVAGISLTESADAIPPFEPPIAFGAGGASRAI